MPCGSDSQPSSRRAASQARPVRWTVLQRLAESPSCVCNLQEHLPIAANLLSYHLRVLREAGLVTTSRRGRWIDYALADDALDRLPSRTARWRSCRGRADERRRHTCRPRSGRQGLSLAGLAALWVLGVLGQRVGCGTWCSTTLLGMPPDDRLTATLHFFFYDTVKIALLLSRDHLRDHDPALLHEHRTHPRPARWAPRGRRQRDGRRTRGGHPVLLVQRRAGVHRVRRRRGPAGRDARAS